MNEIRITENDSIVFHLHSSGALGEGVSGFPCTAEFNLKSILGGIKMKNLQFTLFLFLICITVNVQSQESSDISKKFELKYQMKKGKEFTFFSLGYGNKYAKTNSSLTFISSRERELIQDWEVLSSNENYTVFELEYNKLEFIDTDKEKNITKTNFSPVIGKKVRLTISSNGKMSNFKGFNNLPSVSFPNGEMDSSLYRAELTHMFPILPSKPVKIGDTWSREAWGFTIEYKLISEIEFNGYDCVRIFAQIKPGKTTFERKDQNGNEYNINMIGGGYSDIYYFAYKEGMILYRFSVNSYREDIHTSEEDKILQHLIRDQIWEEHVIFKN